MSELEDKLGAILNNPSAMEQIMSMAQQLGASQAPGTQQAPPEPPPPQMPQIDPKLLQRIFQLTQQSGIDREQQALLSALRPYLDTRRMGKLEKALRSAKMASLASQAITSFGIK